MGFTKSIVRMSLCIPLELCDLQGARLMVIDSRDTEDFGFAVDSELIVRVYVSKSKCKTKTGFRKDNCKDDITSCSAGMSQDLGVITDASIPSFQCHQCIVCEGLAHLSGIRCKPVITFARYRDDSYVYLEE